MTAKEDGYGVFQVSNADIVAAKTQAEALSWFIEAMEVTAEELHELYLKPVELDLDRSIYYVHTPNDKICETTYRDLIQLAIKDELEFPCIIATYDWEPTIPQP